MKLFTDVRIGKRLAIGFGITLVLMVLNVITGLIYLNREHRLPRIVTVNNAKIMHASDIRVLFADVSSLVGDFVSIEDSANRQEITKKLDEKRAKYAHAMEELQRLEVNDEGKNLIEAVKQQAEKGKAENSKVIELASSGNGKEAMEKYKESKKSVEGYTGAADAVIKYNVKRIDFR